VDIVFPRTIFTAVLTGTAAISSCTTTTTTGKNRITSIGRAGTGIDTAATTAGNISQDTAEALVTKAQPHANVSPIEIIRQKQPAPHASAQILQILRSKIAPNVVLKPSAAIGP